MRTNNNLGTGNWRLNNGVLSDRYRQTTEFTAGLGAGDNQIQIFGNSGFGAGNGGSTWRIGTAGSTLQWGSTHFDPTTLQFQSIADNQGPSIYGQVTLDNGLDLNGGARAIDVYGAGSDPEKSSGTVSGDIVDNVGGGSLTKTGSGTLILSGTNTYDGGTTINQGRLLFDGIAAMPDSGNVQVNDGGILGIQVGGGGNWTTGTSGLGTIGGLLAGDGGAGTSTVGYSGNVGVQLDVVSNSTYSGDIVNVGTTLAIHKTGGSSLTLQGNNTYSGGTFLFQGSIIADSATALGSGDITFRGGTLQYTASGAAGDFGSQIANSSSTILINTNGQNATLSDIDSSNTGGLTKSGSGTLTLSGTNAYSGTTTISGGAITLNDGTVSGSGVIFGSSDTTLSVTGGIGVTSTWNAGNQDIQTSSGNRSNLQMVIDGGGVEGSAVVTNVKILNFGRTATNSGILLTNGGQMNVNGEVRLGNPYYSEAGGATMTIGGGTATSTFTGNAGQDFYIGYGERTGSKDNVVTVSTGGVLTNIRDMYVGHVNNAQNNTNPSTNNQLLVTGGTASMRGLSVGYAQISDRSATANVLEVSNGGDLSTTGTSYIGRANSSGSTSNNNTATVSGAGSSWDAGNQDVYVGYTNNATATSTGNILTVGTGGSVTNVGSLVVGGGSGTSTGNQLVVNGILSATTLTVSAGNSLGGTGTIDGAVTVSGTLAAGNSPGTLTFSNALALESTATYLFELTGNGTNDGPADLTNVGGTLSLSNATLDLVQLGTHTAGNKFTLFGYDAVNGLTGTFAGLANGSTFTDAGGGWMINYADSVAGSNGGVGDSFVTITAIPEPSAAALLGALGVLALLRRRR